MKISIITVAYNAEATIGQTAASVLGQEQNRFSLEYIVIDGASTDDTLKALNPYRKSISHLICEPDSGLYDAMNKGIATATGDFIGILNADDTYAHKSVLSAVAAQLAESGAYALYGDLDYVADDGTGRVIRRWRSGTYERASFLHGWMPPHPTFFLAKALFDEHGGYSLDLHSAADYELMLRMLYRHGVRATYLPEICVKMRAGGISNSSWKDRLRANREDRAAWRMNGISPMPWTLILKPMRKIGQWVR